MDEPRRDDEIEELLGSLEELLAEEASAETGGRRVVVLTEEMEVESPQRELPLAPADERAEAAEPLAAPAEDAATGEIAESSEESSEPDAPGTPEIEATAVEDWPGIARRAAEIFAARLAETLPELAEEAVRQALAERGVEGDRPSA